ncbi:MAG: nucleotide exchange factor GrpE [Luteimonas sp.]
MTTETRHDDAGAAPTDEDTLLDQVEALTSELEQLRARTLVERADLDNQRKRLDRDLRNAVRFANKQLLGDLLPVFDSLEAALANAEQADPLRDGVVLTLRELGRVAESNGLIQIAPAAGERFDAERHQAMSVIPAPELAPGTIAQVFQKGYVLNEQLLRPAMVAVTPHD